jgi:hypothetical protein
MANFFANNFLGLLLSTYVSGKTLRMLFAGATCTVDDEDDNVGDIGTLGELSGTGYTAGHGGAGRQALDNLSVTVDDPNNQAELDCDDEVWTSINAGTIEFIILHVAGTADDTDAKILGVYDVSQATNGGNITVSINAEGLLKLGRASGS